MPNGGLHNLDAVTEYPLQIAQLKKELEQVKFERDEVHALCTKLEDRCYTAEAKAAAFLEEADRSHELANHNFGVACDHEVAYKKEVQHRQALEIELDRTKRVLEHNVELAQTDTVYLKRLLRGLQWAGPGGCCPACGMSPTEKHAPDCPVPSAIEEVTA